LGFKFFYGKTPKKSSRFPGVLKKKIFFNPPLYWPYFSPIKFPHWGVFVFFKGTKSGGGGEKKRDKKPPKKGKLLQKRAPKKNLKKKKHFFFFFSRKL